MPTIVFEHPQVSPQTLTVDTGANQFSWGYGLNTVTYPTYAGEVVQILSAYIDNLTVVGEVRSYAKMEEIYSWFLQYMQIATQGNGGIEYSEKPVTMRYPHRGWKMEIQPIALPGLRYGRDVVVPQWTLQAAVREADPEQTDLTIESAMVDPFRTEITSDIGFREANPFSVAPRYAAISAAEAKLWPEAKAITGVGEENSVSEGLDDIASKYNELLTSYLDGTFDTVSHIFGFDTTSKPASKQGSKKNDEDAADKEKSGGKRKDT